MGFLISLALIGIICVCCNKSKGFNAFVTTIWVLFLLGLGTLFLCYIIGCF